MTRMPTATDQRLGTVLQQAGLVSARQVTVALGEQDRSDRLIGEILADHGWLKQESADFFAEVWPWIQDQSWQEPLGQYLKQAALLEESQIQTILQEQRQTQLKFGTLVILKGWVQRRTINFFLEHLDQHQMNSTHARESIHDFAPDTEVIRKGLLENKTVNPFFLLLAYQKILEQGAVTADDSPEQRELLSIGLVVVEQNMLKIPRGLDPLLLSPQWVAQELNQRRPYSQVRLKLFELGKSAERPYQVLAAIRAWTGNQPELTQALYQITLETGVFIAAGQEATQIETLVQDRIIHGWESGAAAEHLLELRDRWLSGQGCQPDALLMLYGRILEEDEVTARGNLEEQALLRLGLIIRTNDTLSIANPIYSSVFNHHWITREIANIETAQELEIDSFPNLKVAIEFPLEAIPDVGEELSVEEVASFSSPTDLEISELPMADSGFNSPVLMMPDMSGELSVDEVASFSLSKDLETSETLVDSWQQASLVTPNVRDRLSVATPESQSVSAIKKPRQLALWIILGTSVIAAIAALIALGTQFWRKPAQVTPLASSPSVEDAPSSASPDERQSYSAVPTQPQNSKSMQNTPKTSAQEQIPAEASTREQTPLSSSSRSTLVVSTQDPSVKVPIFATGSNRQQLLDHLGPPTGDQEGYYPGSRALSYKGIVPNRVDLGYLVNERTGKLLQTEIAFAQSVPLETIQKTLRQLTLDKLPDAAQNGLAQVYQRQADEYTFVVGNWEGEIHRDREDRIYIGIWDADFH